VNSDNETDVNSDKVSQGIAPVRIQFLVSGLSLKAQKTFAFHLYLSAAERRGSCNRVKTSDGVIYSGYTSDWKFRVFGKWILLLNWTTERRLWHCCAFYWRDAQNRRSRRTWRRIGESCKHLSIDKVNA